ncbi:MAG: catalase-peroxidase, partial [Candidatus Aminicenantes bacterium]
FIPGRMDASQEMTDVEFWKMVEPAADGFRNYYNQEKALMSPEEMLVDKAQLLKLTPPEMTVLVGGLRVLKANFGQTNYGVFTHRPRTLTNDFFVHLFEPGLAWRSISADDYLFEGYDSRSHEVKWTATRVDLIFGAESQLRAIGEVYAGDDAQEKFVHDFVAAWNKVMTLDRFDLAPRLG